MRVLSHAGMNNGWQHTVVLGKQRFNVMKSWSSTWLWFICYLVNTDRCLPVQMRAPRGRWALALRIESMRMAQISAATMNCATHCEVVVLIEVLVLEVFGGTLQTVDRWSIYMLSCEGGAGEQCMQDCPSRKRMAWIMVVVLLRRDSGK